jgi:hypothetical protein
MRKKSLLAVAVCTAALAGASASVAFAGEVKGPPGTPSIDGSDPIPPASGRTAAPEHANSACAFSGLNDLRLGQGPVDTIVQTPADGPAGAPGHGAPPDFPIGCRGGSNPENPPSP